MDRKVLEINMRDTQERKEDMNRAIERLPEKEYRQLILLNTW